MDELYVIARRVLLDAFETLDAHLDAITLVGAQAIYLRVGDADLAVAPYTTDGDLAIDPQRLGPLPPLEQALTRAGFAQKDVESVGIWVTKRPTSEGIDVDVAVDLLVPSAVSGRKSRRAARLTGHDSRAARIVVGLEGALVDADRLAVPALEPADSRVVTVRVAGPAALLLAKTHKIDDRSGSDRSSDKDALDVLRLLRGVTTEELERRYRRLLADERSREVAERGLGLLREQFGRRGGSGVAMAIRAVAGLADPDEVTASCLALAGDLLAALQR